VAFSPDGTRLATASQDGTARLWDGRTGQELLALRGHTAVVTSVAFSPDGTRLATASLDGTARLWDARTGQELVVLKGHTGAVFSVCFSPDGTRLATASNDHTARLWDPRTGQEMLTLKGHIIVRSVCFSPDGTRLATVSVDRTVRLWDARKGQELPGKLDFPVEALRLTVSPDGQRLVLYQGDVVRLIDLAVPSGREIDARLWATRRDPSWHADQVKALEKEAMPFAIAFHRALAAGLHPAALSGLRYAVALTASGRYADAALALLRAAAATPEDDTYPLCPTPMPPVLDK
jgi:uncharacterized protein with WD repeat